MRERRVVVVETPTLRRRAPQRVAMGALAATQVQAAAAVGARARL
jgi:hypothetical protein